MLYSKKDAEYLIGVVGGMISAVILIVLKIFMLYNLWQDVFVINNVVASFKSIILYVLFAFDSTIPLCLSIFKYLGVEFNFAISATTIWLSIACIISGGFFNTFYRMFKDNK